MKYFTSIVLVFLVQTTFANTFTLGSNSQAAHTIISDNTTATAPDRIVINLLPFVPVVVGFNQQAVGTIDFDDDGVDLTEGVEWYEIPGQGLAFYSTTEGTATLCVRKNDPSANASLIIKAMDSLKPADDISPPPAPISGAAMQEPAPITAPDSIDHPQVKSEIDKILGQIGSEIRTLHAAAAPAAEQALKELEQAFIGVVGKNAAGKAGSQARSAFRKLGLRK